MPKNMRTGLTHYKKLPTKSDECRYMKGCSVLFSTNLEMFMNSLLSTCRFLQGQISLMFPIFHVSESLTFQQHEHEQFNMDFQIQIFMSNVRYGPKLKKIIKMVYRWIQGAQQVFYFPVHSSLLGTLCPINTRFLICLGIM